MRTKIRMFKLYQCISKYTVYLGSDGEKQETIYKQIFILKIKKKQVVLAKKKKLRDLG